MVLNNKKNELLKCIVKENHTHFNIIGKTYLNVYRYVYNICYIQNINV